MEKQWKHKKKEAEILKILSKTDKKMNKAKKNMFNIQKVKK